MDQLKVIKNAILIIQLKYLNLIKPFFFKICLIKKYIIFTIKKKLIIIYYIGKNENFFVMK